LWGKVVISNLVPIRSIVKYRHSISNLSFVAQTVLIGKLALAKFDFFIISISLADFSQICHEETLGQHFPKSQGRGISKPEVEKLWEE